MKGQQARPPPYSYTPSNHLNGPHSAYDQPGSSFLSPDTSGSNSGSGRSGRGNQVVSAQISFVQGTTQNRLHVNHQYPCQKQLTRLAYFQLILSILMFILGCGCVHNLVVGYGGHLGCYLFTSVWSGLLAIISGTFAVAAVRRPNNYCLLITWFVLAIITTCASVILLIFSSIWAGVAGNRLSYLQRSDDRRLKDVSLTDSMEFNHQIHYGFNYSLEIGSLQISLTINLLLILLSLTYSISCIASCALSCYRWAKTSCCGDSTESTPVPASGAQVVYFANQPSAAQQNLMLNQQLYPMGNQPLRTAYRMRFGSSGTAAPPLPLENMAPPSYESVVGALPPHY